MKELNTMKHFYLILFLFLSISICYPQTGEKGITAYILPEFSQGKVLMKSGESYNASLNYDALTEEMVFVNKGNKLAIADEEVELVDTIYFSGREFVTLNHKFVEVLYHSSVALYAGYKCKLSNRGKPGAYGDTSQTSAITTASGFYSGTNRYDLSTSDRFQKKPYTWYWLMKKGKLNRFINLKQLANLYRDKAEKFNAYLKENDVNFDNQGDITKLISYLETD
jgi:hypothetical protein